MFILRPEVAVISLMILGGCFNQNCENTEEAIEEHPYEDYIVEYYYLQCLAMEACTGNRSCDLEDSEQSAIRTL